jgi:hypothetical protein
VQSQADQAFVNNLDDIRLIHAQTRVSGSATASNPCRANSAVSISGPVFWPTRCGPFGNLPKHIGFNRLDKHGWFHRICLLDEYLFMTGITGAIPVPA